MIKFALWGRLYVNIISCLVIAGSNILHDMTIVSLKIRIFFKSVLDNEARSVENFSFCPSKYVFLAVFVFYCSNTIAPCSFLPDCLAPCSQSFFCCSLLPTINFDPLLPAPEPLSWGPLKSSQSALYLSVSFISI